MLTVASWGSHRLLCEHAVREDRGSIRVSTRIEGGLSGKEYFSALPAVQSFIMLIVSQGVPGALAVGLDAIPSDSTLPDSNCNLAKLATWQVVLILVIIKSTSIAAALSRPHGEQSYYQDAGQSSEGKAPLNGTTILLVTLTHSHYATRHWYTREDLQERPSIEKVRLTLQP